MEYTIQRGESASTAVVSALAAYTDQPPESVGPLYDIVEPDALDALVDHQGELTVRFVHEGTEIVVTTDSVRINAAEDAVSESQPES
ncbi:HalOD1 output domain-containing protein [Natronolimnobius baerhuensis]|uniref:Halobacterial output domain-containing protein n=1 Tax=Natronolimnobius baerhuensis TaxID=253108 RepID=A0A202E4I9_9EURY|nr:HalOD1 output domain-containing protein [Natronolimnobius baerhuensis]OVE83147.1 hypothetical protein B2G88_17200 [Natronolimnobius baerhuensis]